MQIFKIIDIGQNSPGCRVVLQIIQHPIHLVEHTLFIPVLQPQLVTIGFADGTVFSCPLIPDVAAQVRNAVGLFLPDPQQLIHGAFPVGPAQSHNFIRGTLECRPAQGQNGKLLC